jgi:hypothetical protein
MRLEQKGGVQGVQGVQTEEPGARIQESGDGHVFAAKLAFKDSLGRKIWFACGLDSTDAMDSSVGAKSL